MTLNVVLAVHFDVLEQGRRNEILAWAFMQVRDNFVFQILAVFTTLAQILKTTPCQVGYNFDVFTSRVSHFS